MVDETQAGHDIDETERKMVSFFSLVHRFSVLRA